MSSISQDMRDEILKVVDALHLHDVRGETPNLTHYAVETPHPDTARLDWLSRRVVRNGMIKGSDTGLWVCSDEYVLSDPCDIRAIVDAAMKPAPKYRPWTQEEAPGIVIRKKKDHKCVRMVLHKDPDVFVLSDQTFWPERELDQHWESYDGSPCGVEVKP